MKIPKTIKIGGHQYKVIFPYIFTERFDMIGDHDPMVKVIRIAEVDGNLKIADSAIVVTLIHEILHAIDRNSGHNMFVGGEGEEHIKAISEGIYQVLADNPKLVSIPYSSGLSFRSILWR